MLSVGVFAGAADAKDPVTDAPQTSAPTPTSNGQSNAQPMPAASELSAATGSDKPVASQDRWRISGNAGLVMVGSRPGFQLTVGAGYLIVPGLDLGLDASLWITTDRKIFGLAPGLTYTLPLNGNARPYVGAFYNRYFAPDDQLYYQHSVGARGGMQYAQNGFNLRGGFRVERILDVGCQDTTSGCIVWYPELGASLSF